MKAQMPDVIVPPLPPVPPVLPPEPPERDDPAEPGGEPDWSDDELPPVVNQQDEHVLRIDAFELWTNEAGELQGTFHTVDGHTVMVHPHRDHYSLPLGFYDADMRPILDPYV